MSASPCRFFVVLMAAAMAAIALIGCETIYPLPANPICGQVEYAESVICAIGRHVGLEAEQMDTMLLDASLLPVAVKAVKAEQMKKSLASVRTWVIERDILTMSGIVAYLQAQAKVDPSLAMLISRRLPMFTEIPGLSIKPFQPIDKAMVLQQIDHQDAQFKFF